MKRLFLTLACLITALSVGYAQDLPPASAEAPPPVPGGRPPEMAMEKKFEMFDLTAEQKDKIEAARVETRKAVIPIKAEIELKQIDLQSEMRLDKPDRKKIMKLASEINALELEIKKAELDQRLKIHSILTAEQREKLKAPRHKLMDKCPRGCEEE